MSASFEHTAGRVPTLPLKNASPVELNRTEGVWTSTEFPPPALPSTSQTSVPCTAVTGPSVPIVIQGSAGKNQATKHELDLALAKVNAGCARRGCPRQKSP